MFARFAALSLFALSACNTGVASTGVPASFEDTHSSDIARFASECEQWDDWDKPAKPFQIYGDTYYVGTCGIASILIVNEFAGDILIDSGTEIGVDLIIENVASLRPHLSHPLMIGHVLYSHEHFDHVGGHAKLQQILPDARFYAAPAAADVFRTGQAHADDPQFGMHDPLAPIRIDEVVTPDLPMGPGGLRSIATPGHSPGAVSWQWTSCDGTECKTIVYADSMSPVSRDGYRFSDHPEYVAEYRAGIARIAALDCDILLTPHPSHSRMIERAATGTLEGGMTCSEYAERKSRDLDARLEREAGAAE